MSRCECKDFKNNNKPCKHMYKLAYELNLHDLYSENLKNNLFKYYYCKNYNIEKIKSIIGDLTNESLFILKTILKDSCWEHGNKQFLLENNNELNLLIKKKFFEICSKIKEEKSF
ncbi:MAG: SWIM zinc finger family protein [Bacillus subtilis]|nr:SWIM zinc finger family protein [Bacillus subtilis]